MEQVLDITVFEKIKSLLFGVAVGDALGVPVEFKSRDYLMENPITDMTGFGTYCLPPGTWSDDSSLTFCLAESLSQEFDINSIAHNFLKWLYQNYWTATGYVFDIGIATRQAIDRLKNGIAPELAGNSDEFSNGNGSLMRISPLLFYIIDKPINERFELTKQVSSITHAHIRSVIACFYYLEFAKKLLENQDKFTIYKDLQKDIPLFLNSINIDNSEIDKFERLLTYDIWNLSEELIKSDGYVIHSLEASIWCILTTDNFRDAVLKAVNLGYDSDTTAAVTGGLAGLLYGYDNIPQNWIQQLARKNDIENLADRMSHNIIPH